MFFFEDPEKLAHPSASYAEFREREPVYWYESGKAWVIFRYDDVDRLLHDARLSNRRATGVFAAAPQECQPELHRLQPIFESWMLMKDGQEHMAVRRAFQAYFSERSVRALQPKIRATVAELMEPLQRTGRMDFAADFAYQLPIRVIADMLRVRAEDHPRVVGWSDHLSEFFNSVPPSVEQCHNVVKSTFEMADYVREALADARRNPGGDVLSHVVDLAEDLIVANAVVLLVAGHETLRNALGSCLALLLDHPEQLRKVQADPSLIQGAMMEALRLEPANPIMGRLALEDLEVRGKTIRKGDLVILSLGSANRDPEHFPDPDRYDIHRKAGKHLAFGSGPHFCLGSILARMEIAQAMEHLLSSYPNLRKDPDAPERWTSLPGIRGPVSLPIVAS